MDSVMAFMHFQMARVETKAARESSNAATWMLYCRLMEERSAELASQSFASLALSKKLGEITDREREIGIAFARYVATGRTD